MLQTIRDKSSGWLSYIVLGLVILAMAFFGIESYFSPKLETFAARIQGPGKLLGFGGQEREISQGEFRQRFDQTRAQERARQGEAFDSEAFESLDSKRQVLDSLIDEALLTLVAERDGIVVGERTVADELKKVPEFQVDGAYSADQYRLSLASRGMTHAQFMAQMRGDMARRLVPGEIIESALASEAELESFLKLSQQTRDLRLLDLPTPSLPGEPATDEQLQAWYDEHAASYRSEEKVAIEYVEIDAASLDAADSVDDDTLRGRYDAQRARFVTEPQRVASHILVAVPADAGADAESAAQARAASLAEQARAEGADFAALARENSDDLGSKAQGGDLGVVEAGQFDPSFEAALFALQQAGQVSDPVRMSDGWHVIQLRDLVPGSERSFDEVKDELRAEYLESERERAYSDLSGRLIERIYKDPTALAPAAEAEGLTVQRTALFTRDRGEGVAALPAVREAAFSEAQRVERQVSDGIEIGPSHMVVIHVVENEPEAAIPFDQVRDRVLADFNGDRLATAAKAQAEALMARANAGESLDALATEVGRTVAEQAGVRRQGQLPPALLDAAFRLAPPEEDKVQVGMARLAPDRYALVAVTAVKPGDLADLDDQTRTLLRDQFAQARGVVEYQDYVKSLRQQYTVTVAEDRL